MIRITQVFDVSVSKTVRDSASKLVYKDDRASWEFQQKSLEEYRDIRDRLQEMKAQHDEMAVFQLLAKDNPEAQKLLERLNTWNSEQASLTPPSS